MVPPMGKRRADWPAPRAAIGAPAGYAPSVPDAPAFGPAQNPDAIAFVLRLGRALHTYGSSAQRLEDVLGRVADRLGLHGHQFFSTPTSIMAAFGYDHAQRTFLQRVEPGDVDLGKLARLDAVSVLVLRGALAPSEGTRAIAEIVAAPPRYGDAVRTLAYGLASAAASRFLGGGLREALVAGAIGLLLGLLSLLAQRYVALNRIFEPLAAFCASAVAALLARALGPFSSDIATLAGLIALLPGLTLTIAMTELATRHLASGTARLSGAFMVFLGIAFGVALGSRFGSALVGAVPSAVPLPLPAWTGALALLVAPLCYTVILRAEPGDAKWIVVTGVLAVAGGRVGTIVLGLQLGVFVGSLTVGVASNLFARLRDRPSTVTLVPGILLLVPGSIGFRSLASLLDRKVMAGVETAFAMILTAVALVTGLLIANVIAPARREI